MTKLFAHNWWAILYFNFKMLPFAQAIKLPFDFYYKIRFVNISGKININTRTLRRGMIKIGGRGSEMFSKHQTILDIKGLVVFNGTAEIGHGALLRVEKNAKVSFGHNSRIGALSKIFSENEIWFGDELDFSWECQIFDTNFHDLKEVNSGLLTNKTEKVFIASYNWFGNRVSVMKGTKTNEYLTVAANSLCNKDYSALAPYSVIAGSPAKLVAKDKMRIFENISRNEQ
ncbi:MAG: hypothetical protein PW786_00400 [Arachidicoccus sp.]|nr:hypothetical protein [Arachidicoccus sp.]